MDTMPVVQEKTCQYQADLPSLPVPPLSKTLDKYLESVKPFVNEEEFKYTEKVVKDFEDGLGKDLQIELKERAKQHRNWLEDWWEQLAYLSSRNSIALDINYAGPHPYHEDVWPPKYGSQLERMSILFWCYAKIALMFRREELPIDKAKALGNKPMCMAQYYSILNVCRVPGITSDTIVRACRPESEGPSPNHIAVFRNGYIFSVDVIDEDGEPIPPPELLKQLIYIKSKCDSRVTAGPGIGALTAWDRTSWAETRQRLIELDPDNETRLHVIETCIICMVMDVDNSPTTGEQIGGLTMSGPDVYNRWFDKSTIVIYSNGTIGSTTDHTPADAISGIVKLYHIHKILKEIGGRWKSDKPLRRNVPMPEELKFTVNEKIQRDIKEAADHYLDRAKELQVFFKHFTYFGKNIMRSFNVHPDTFLQQVIQLTNYKVHGRPVPTYESASTRQFYHGRTDTVRSCTMESLEWCKAMVDAKTTSARKLELFHNSVDKHNQLMFEAIQGQGCDRHLLGLQILAVSSGHPMPEIFTDQAWTKSGGNGNFVLSTSLVGFSQSIGCFAPMLPNGYGIAYTVEEKRIGFSLTSWRDNPETDAFKFYSTLVDTVLEMKALLTNAKL
ncbi:peroxisomal carnitine O-octanoyltransferase-like [Glandiceps talaboti]